MNKNEIQDLRTYEDYVDLGKVNTKRYLMLAELIDNSISSFDEKYTEGNWEETLKIDILIMNPKVETKDFNGIDYFPYSNIVVSDNAFGIKESKMADALRLNKKNETKKSKMNVHGRGLKQSSFYFGLGVVLVSKHEDSDKVFEVRNEPIENGLHTDVKYVVKESKEKLEKGTRVIIQDLRKNHRFTQARLDDVFLSLEYRYAKLIGSGKMKINFKYQIDDMDDFEPYQISKTPDDVARVKEDFDYPIKVRKEIVRVANERVEKLIKGSKGKDKFHLYKSLAEETANKLSDIILTGDLNDKFNWKQRINVNDDEITVMDFWFLSTKEETISSDERKESRAYSNKRGIRVDEGDRSILHPPIITNEVSTYLDPLPPKNRSGSVDNRFAGRVNISDFSASTTTDKSTFEFRNLEDKERFDGQISVIFDVFEQFVIQGRSSNKKSVAAKMTKEDEDKLPSTINGKFGDVILGIEFTNGERTKLNAKIKVNDEYFDADININTDNNKHLIRVTVDEDKKLVRATWFNNNNLWKNINENKNFNVEAMIPIFFLLTMQEISFKIKIKKYKEFMTNEQMDEVSPSSNINEASEKVR